MSKRSEQIGERVKQISAEFINKESNGRSIISVTTVDINDKSDMATVFITVMPEKEEAVAIDFLRRKRSEMRKYIMKKLPIARIPFLDVKIDAGEKLMQKITRIEISEAQK
jgi:ribosome-binding factor A